jgi:hypothetical protein
LGEFIALRVLIVGYVWPEPNSSAAGRRMLSLISALQSNGGEVHFVSAAVKGDHSVDLSALGVCAQPVALNCDSFDDYIGELRPELVIFDRFLNNLLGGWTGLVLRPCAF